MISPNQDRFEPKLVVPRAMLLVNKLSEPRSSRASGLAVTTRKYTLSNQLGPRWHPSTPGRSRRLRPDHALQLSFVPTGTRDDVSSQPQTPWYAVSTPYSAPIWLSFATVMTPT